MLQGIVSGAGWFTVFLVVHVVWFHVVQVKDCFKWIVKAMLLCVLAHIGTIFILEAGTKAGGFVVLRSVYGILIMASLFILYMPFYYTIVASLSIQTLICLEEAPRKALSMTQLRERFASRDIVAGRLEIMASNGYLEPGPSGYRATSKARVMSSVFGFLKAAWKLGPGG
jgi:hypothetical protein